jgi:FKBP12-rapamycin complex-associated protein
MLSMILAGHGYRPLGAPPPLARDTNVSRDAGQTPNGVRDKTPELITLALDTLGSFDFSGKPCPLLTATARR